MLDHKGALERALANLEKADEAVSVGRPLVAEAHVTVARGFMELAATRQLPLHRGPSEP